jgi:hypothetical protein
MLGVRREGVTEANMRIEGWLPESSVIFSMRLSFVRLFRTLAIAAGASLLQLPKNASEIAGGIVQCRSIF